MKMHRQDACASLPAKQLLRFFGVTLLEALDPAGRIDKLLRAGEERMAFRANADAHVLVGGPRLNHIAAGTVNHRIDVFRMNLGFHESGRGNLQEPKARCKPNLSTQFVQGVSRHLPKKRRALNRGAESATNTGIFLSEIQR